MSKHRELCSGCHQKFPITELHIDPNTSEWFCDPCYNMVFAEQLGDDEPQTETWESDESED